MIWPTRPLGELTVNHDGKRRPVKEADRRPGPFPYYGASGVVDYVDDYLIDGDYLLIAEDGENLRTRQTPIAFMARGKSWVNNHAHIVTGNNQADTRFLMYALQATDIGGYLTGAVMPKLTQANLNRIEIPCPHIDVQRDIAGVLGALDDKIELNRRIGQTLGAIAQAIFKSRFVDGTPDAGNLVTLKDLTSKIGSGATPRGGRDDYVDEGVGLIRSQNVYDSQFVWDGLARITDEAASQLANVQVQPGDVLLNITGASILRTCVVPPDVLPARVNQHVAIIRAKPGVSPHYLHLHLLQPDTKAYLLGLNAGASREAVTKAHIESVPVPDPGADRMAEFHELVAPLFSQAQALAAEARTLAALRDSLLPKLLSGELNVLDAEAVA